MVDCSEETKNVLEDIAENKKVPFDEVLETYNSTYEEIENKTEDLDEESKEKITRRTIRMQIERRKETVQSDLSFEKEGYDLSADAESLVSDSFEIISPDFIPTRLEIADISKRIGEFNFREEETGWWAREWNNDHITVNGELLCEEDITKYDESDGEFIEDRTEYMKHLRNKPSDKGICFNCNFILVGLACYEMQKKIQSGEY